YTGLETVANLAEETRRPGRDLPRSLFSAIGLVVLLYVAIAVVAISAFPAKHGTLLGSNWVRAPLVGVAARIREHVPEVIGAPVQVFVGLSGALILLTAATTSISGFGRLAYSLGEHGQLPRKFGLLRARTLVAPRPRRGRVLTHPRTDEARRDRRGDDRDGGQARAGPGRVRRSAARDPRPDGAAPRSRAPRRGRAGRGLDRRGQAARRRPRGDR